MQENKVYNKKLYSNKQSMNPTYGVTCYRGKELVYTWYIDNFKTAFIDDEPLTSPKFSTNIDEEITWFLKMSSFNSEQQILQLFISLQAGQNIGYKNKVCVDIALVDGKGNEKLSVQSLLVPKDVISETSGANLYLKRTDVNDELLRNGTLIIKCKLFFMDKIVEETDSKPLQNGKSCDCNLEELFQTKKLCDTILITGEQIFEAHMCVLAARSPVFLQIFEHIMKEKNKNEVEIDDVEPHVIEEMLQYIYCGKTQGFQDISSLLIAADKFQIAHLKSICEYQLIQDMNAENVGKTLILADRSKAEVLKKSVIKFIVTHSSEIQFDKFKEDVQSYSPLLIDMVRGLI